MDTLVLGPWTVLVDRDATSEACRRMKGPGSETCRCGWCRNWIAARDPHLPDALRRLLDRLGVDPAKDVEIYELETDEDAGVVHYGGWYAFVGRVAAGPDSARPSVGAPGSPLVVEAHYEDIGDGVQVSFASGCDLLPGAFEDLEVASLDLSLTMPQVVERRELP